MYLLFQGTSCSSFILKTNIEKLVFRIFLLIPMLHRVRFLCENVGSYTTWCFGDWVAFFRSFYSWLQAKRLPYREARVSQVHRGSFSQGSWIGEMQQASDKSVIISEILDPRTKNLLSMSKISDYVLSNELVSMALAMVAEDRQINDVLEELFAEEVLELTPLNSYPTVSNSLLMIGHLER